MSRSASLLNCRIRVLNLAGSCGIVGKGACSRSSPFASRYILLLPQPTSQHAVIPAVADAELERERGLHRRELRRRAKEADSTLIELETSRATVRDLRGRCKQLTDEIDSMKRRQSATAKAPRYGIPGASRWKTTFGKLCNRHCVVVGLKTPCHQTRAAIGCGSPAKKPSTLYLNMQGFPLKQA